MVETTGYPQQQHELTYIKIFRNLTHNISNNTVWFFTYDVFMLR